MSDHADRLAYLVAEISRLEALQPELKRQREECRQLEEMVKSLRWEAYQAEQAYREVEAEENSVLGWLGRLFGGNRPDKEELFQAALQARDSYEAAREKFKPLRQELEELEAELNRLPDLKAEQLALLDQQTEALRIQGDSTFVTCEELNRQISLVRSLLGELADIRKLGLQAQSALRRCDDDTLFATRQTMRTFQNAVVTLLERLLEAPAEWHLPPQIAINEVRLLDPVGTGVGFRPPDMSDVPLSLQGSLLGLRAREEAVQAAIRAANEAVRDQARYQVMLVEHWLTRLQALEQRLTEILKELEQMRVSVMLGAAGHAAGAGSETVADSGLEPPVGGISVPGGETGSASLVAGAGSSSLAPGPKEVLNVALQRVVSLALETVRTRMDDTTEIRSIHLVAETGDSQQVDFHLERLDDSVQYLFPPLELTEAIKTVNEAGAAFSDQWRGFELVLLTSGESHLRLL